MAKRKTVTVPAQEPNKALITIRLRQSTVDFYRRTGRGWQTRLSNDLDGLVWDKVKTAWLNQPLDKSHLQRMLNERDK